MSGQIINIMASELNTQTEGYQKMVPLMKEKGIEVVPVSELVI